MNESSIKFKSVAPVLPSLNFRQTIDFYTQKLGFRLIGQYPDYLILTRDDIGLHFWLCQDAKLPEISSCYLYVSGVEKIYEEFDKQGVIHHNGKLTQTYYGIKEFAALDVHGNLLRIGEVIQS